MALSRPAKRVLGKHLPKHAHRTVREMIRARGGTASNVRFTGQWADKTLAEAAEAAAAGDGSAKTAIKIVKQAKKQKGKTS